MSFETQPIRRPYSESSDNMPVCDRKRRRGGLGVFHPKTRAGDTTSIRAGRPSASGMQRRSRGSIRFPRMRFT